MTRDLADYGRPLVYREPTPDWVIVDEQLDAEARYQTRDFTLSGAAAAHTARRHDRGDGPSERKTY